MSVEILQHLVKHVVGQVILETLGGSIVAEEK